MFKDRGFFDPLYWLLGLSCLLISLLLSASLFKEMALLIGGVAGLVLLFAGGVTQLYVLVIYCFGILGPVQYFTNIEGQWGAYLIALLLFPSCILGALRQRRGNNSGESNGLAFVWIFLFAIFLIVASLANHANKYLLLASVRNQFFFFGVSVFLALGVVSRKAFCRFLSVFDFFVCIQLPFAIYQHFVIVPQRHDSVAWDSVVGSFQGRPFSGGDSGGMAFFLVVMILFLAYRYLEGLVSLRRLLFVGFCGVATILLAEVKVVFVLLPVGMIILFWRQLLTNAKFLISVLLIIVPLVLIMGSLYKLSDSEASVSSGDGVVERVLKFSTSTEQINRLTGELGRGAALNIWYRDALAGDPVYALVGHGLGASSSSNDAYKGDIALKYFPFLVDNTSIVTLLWDAGLVGAIFYLSFYVFLSVKARFDLFATDDKELRAIKAFSHLVLTLFILMMFYNRDGLFASPPVQLVLFSAIGAALYNGRKMEQE